MTYMLIAERNTEEIDITKNTKVMGKLEVLKDKSLRQVGRQRILLLREFRLYIF